MKNSRLLMLICTVSLSHLLSGCASITTNSGQVVAVETVSPKEKLLVTHAECNLSNDKGTWKVTTPATVTIQKSGADLMVLCTKSELEPGSARVISKAGAAMWGNAIIGGGIGAIIDHSKGTAYNYPAVITVVMGEAITIPQPKSKKANNAK